MNFYNITLEKKPENGAGFTEIMQYKMVQLDNAIKALEKKADSQQAEIERLDVLLSGRTLSRLDRWKTSDRREMLINDLHRTHDKATRLFDEYKGIRKAVDVLIALQGGELSDQNRRRIDNILSEPAGLF